MNFDANLAPFPLSAAARSRVQNGVDGLLQEVSQSAAQEGQKLVRELAQKDQELVQSQQDLTQSQQDLTQSQQALSKAQRVIELLQLELSSLRRQRFGQRAEAFTHPQRSLFEEDLDADMDAVQALAEQAQPSPKPKAARKNAGRQALPEHLPRTVVMHEPESLQCKACDSDLVKVGQDISEQLQVEPAKFWVEQHIRPQYACRCCQTMSAAPVAPAVIDGALAGTSVLAWVVTQKYLDHLPLYRIEHIAARSQVALSRSSLSAWVGRVGVALQPLADRLAQLQRAQGALHADETPVAQLDPGQGKTKRAYLWAYRTVDSPHSKAPRIVVFDYQSGRGGKHAADFLKDWKGELMVDDYAGYKALFAAGITELACWAHVRRKFFDLQASTPHVRAAQALAHIQALYAIERQAQDQDMGCEQKAQLRRTQAQPKLQALFDWLSATLQTSAPGSAIARAVAYTLKRWPALIRYAQNGERPIDNNPVENAIRPIAIGRKNWLFAGSELAGKRAAAIQSLLATAKLNGLDPAAWLQQTLDKLPTCLNSRIDELLPFAR